MKHKNLLLSRLYIYLLRSIFHCTNTPAIARTAITTNATDPSEAMKYFVIYNQVFKNYKAALKELFPILIASQINTAKKLVFSNYIHFENIFHLPDC